MSNFKEGGISNGVYFIQWIVFDKMGAKKRGVSKHNIYKIVFIQSSASLSGKLLGEGH